MTEAYLATGLFAKNLFSANPTIIINEVNPILQDFEASLMRQMRLYSEDKRLA